MRTTQQLVEALDRHLDSLRNGKTDLGHEDDAVLSPLAQIRPADWPDRAAGQRIAAQVASAFRIEEPAEREHSLIPWMRPENEDGGRGSCSRGSGLRRTRFAARSRSAVLRRPLVLAPLAAVLASAAAMLVVIGFGAVGGPPSQPVVYHSGFTATAIAPGSNRMSAGNRTGSWQLASYLTGAGWQAGQVGASADDVSCPSAAVCYMTAARPIPISGYNLPSSAYNILETTRDGGATWSALQMPSDISVTTPLQCPRSVSTCFAAGYDANQVVLLATNDAGQSWSALQIPGSFNFADDLTCSSDLRCVGLFTSPGWAPGYNERANNAVVLVTGDGGRSWSAGPPVPRGQLPDYLTCRDSTCVVFDQLITTDNGQSVNGNGQQTVAPGSWAAWYSHDGGATWHRGQHPGSIWTMASHDLPMPGTISCSDGLHCWAAMSNEIGEPGIATAFLTTSDGGLSWTAEQLPVQRAKQFIPLAMSCPTAQQCYAGGGDSDGPVILTTLNGGLTWSPVSLPATRTGNVGTSAIEPAVGLLSCAAATHCVAGLQTEQNARFVPIYSLGAWQG